QSPLQPAAQFPAESLVRDFLRSRAMTCCSLRCPGFRVRLAPPATITLFKSCPLEPAARPRTLISRVRDSMEFRATTVRPARPRRDWASHSRLQRASKAPAGFLLQAQSSAPSLRLKSAPKAPGPQSHCSWVDLRY